MNNKYLFSVIMPIYNVEKYLEEAILSLINQSIGFKNIQVLLINDGSPDNSEEICLRYKEKFPDNVVYLKKENGGVATARNLGLEHATGEIVNFLDPDDKWEEKTFEYVYKFFEEHNDEVDVVSTRIKLFEYQDDFHFLDYKFKKGTRVADLSLEEEFFSVQSHINVFIKREAIDNLRFDTEMEYNEDSVFVNKMIVKKLKYGLLREGIYYYRKRISKNSAVDKQAISLSYYTTSLTNYHLEMFRYSKKLYGEIVPYVQSIIAYDMMWRFCKPQLFDVLSDEKERELFFKRVRYILSQIDERLILKNPKHNSIVRRSEAILYRDGVDLLKSLVLNEDDETFYYKDIAIMKVSRNMGKTCQIVDVRIKNKRVYFDILLAKWLTKATATGGVPFLKADDTLIPITGEDYFCNLIKTRYGEKPYYNLYKVSFPIDKLEKGNTIKVKLVIRYGDLIVPVSLAYGKFVANSNDSKFSYSFFGNYAVKCYRTVINISFPKNKNSSLKKWEDECIEWLNEKNLTDVVKIRKDLPEYRNKLKSDGKIWLISDNPNSDNHYGEKLFNHLSKKKIKGVNPVFAVCSSLSSDEIKRLKKIGKVISFDDAEYPYYFLCADKIISTSSEDSVINPFNNKRKYLIDLFSFKYYYIYDNINIRESYEAFNRYNKNIRLFFTSDKDVQQEVLSSNYNYLPEQVINTGTHGKIKPGKVLNAILLDDGTKVTVKKRIIRKISRIKRIFR